MIDSIILPDGKILYVNGAGGGVSGGDAGFVENAYNPVMTPNLFDPEAPAENSLVRNLKSPRSIDTLKSQEIYLVRNLDLPIVFTRFAITNLCYTIQTSSNVPHRSGDFSTFTISGGQRPQRHVQSLSVLAFNTSHQP
ncbi:hypothetical protein BSLG_005875 [Batrachochytrium salamandrivorans]|nr:hypothetical protein BSLG_005875 [Batrachochytrium salamandrivorans]